MERTSVRLHGIDALRGLTVLSMVAYHFLYDVNMIYGRSPHWNRASPVFFWQQCICWSFILISGFVWPRMRGKQLRRGLVINLWGLVITAVSCVAVPSEAVWFGVLNFLGCAVLLLLPLDRGLKRLNPWLGLGVSFALFWLFRHVDSGYLSITPLFRLDLPKALYTTRLLTPLGFPYPGFRSSDYFPMLPWFFLYLCGYFLHGVFLRYPGLQRPLSVRVPVLDLIGRRSLPVYLLHQPLCMLICVVLFDLLRLPI